MDTAILDRTKQMLDVLEEEQLQAINMVAKAFMMDSPFRQKTEKEFLEDIDESISQADHGQTKDAFESLESITAEIEDKRNKDRCCA